MLNFINFIKLRFIMTLWVISISIFAAAVCVLAQTGGALSLGLIITSDPIGPIEPLHFQLVITNTGTQDIQGLAPWATRSTTVVEVRAPGSSEWQSLEVPLLNRFATKYPIGGLPLFALRAGESQTIELSVVSD